jgi:hypothetical protein
MRISPQDVYRNIVVAGGYSSATVPSIDTVEILDLGPIL